MSEQKSVSMAVEFHARYCELVERMTACFYGRIHKACTLIILVLVFTLVTHTANPPFAGLMIILIVGYQFSYTPGDVAERAERQALHYAEVLYDQYSLTDDEVRKRLKSLEPKDSKLLRSIRRAGYIQACVATGNVQTAEDEFKKLNPVERFIIFIAGGIQK